MKEVISIGSSPCQLGTEFLAVMIAIPVIVSVLGTLPSDPASAGDWGPRILVTDDNVNNTQSSYYASVAIDAFGNVYVAWEEVSELDGSGIDTDIFLRKYNAFAMMWEPRLLITNSSTEHSASPEVETDIFGNVHVVWRDNTDFDEIGVLGFHWKMWNATTNTWSRRVQYTYAGDESRPTWVPRIAADSAGNVHAIWPDKGIPSLGVQYRKWNASTQLWGDRMTVSGNSTGFYETNIAVDLLGNVHIVWSDSTAYLGPDGEKGTDKDIFYRRLDPTTATCGPIVHLTDDDMNDEDGSQSVDIVTDVSGNVHVVWQEYRDQAGLGYGLDGDIFYKKWNASSGMWEPRRVLSDDPADVGHSSRPKIATDFKGDLFVVWEDGSDVDGAGTNRNDIFYRKWNATNNTWEDTTSLTNDLNDEYNAGRPAVASDRHGNLTVAWEDFSGLLDSGDDTDIYMRRLEVPMEAPKAAIDCDPGTLNLKSQGRWMTCYVELPSGHDPRNIDASTILLNDVLAPELDPKYGFVRSETSHITDHDRDGVPERMVKFDRSEVQKILSPGDSVLLTITGKLFDGTEFEATDIIRVIDVGGRLEGHWAIHSGECLLPNSGIGPWPASVHLEMKMPQTPLSKKNSMSATPVAPDGDSPSHNSSKLRLPESYLYRAPPIAVPLI